MNALQNGSRLARWKVEHVAGYVVHWVEWPDGRASTFCLVHLPGGRRVHLTGNGPMNLAGLTVADVYKAADAYVRIVSACMGWSL